MASLAPSDPDGVTRSTDLIDFAQVVGGVGVPDGSFTYEKTTVPTDLRPRLLDQLSQEFQDPRLRRTLHNATHLSLGIDASQQLSIMVGDDWGNLRQDLAGFAPHPFEDYTLTFFMGIGNGEMAECGILVQQGPDGPRASEMVVLPHRSERIVLDGLIFMGREYARTAKLSGSPNLDKKRESIIASWKFIDTFRLMLAAPGALTLNKGTTLTRTGLYKGRRVTYYTSTFVTLDLDKLQHHQIVQHTGSGRAMPNYGYRAHLCHSGGDCSCEHHWIEIGGRMFDDRWQPDAEHPRLNATWECYHCGRRRWHRRAGERGSLAVGEVRQTYRIKKGSRDVVPA